MKKFFFIFGLCLLLSGGIFFLYESPSSKKSAQPSVLVQVISLKKEALSSVVEAYGTLQVNPKTTQAFSLPIATVIQHFYAISGAVVKKGDPLFDYLPDLSVQLSYKQAQNNFIFAQNEAKRTQQLYTQQLATQSQLAAVNKAVQDAKQALNVAQSQGSTPILQVVKAPFDGVVMNVASNVGNNVPVAAGTVLFQLGQCHDMMALLNIEPSDIAKIKPHSPATIALLDETSAHYQGTVTQVTYAINPLTRLMDVWISLPSLSCETTPNELSVKGKIRLDQKMLWTIPSSALLKEKNGYFIYRIKQNVAQKVNVTPVIYTDNYVGIEGNLNANDAIVILGNYELKDHMRVRIQ